MREANFYRTVRHSGARPVVECTLCESRCRLAEGESGACGIRSHRGGRMFTEADSVLREVRRTSIEGAGFYHVLPGSQALVVALSSGAPRLSPLGRGLRDFDARPDLTLGPGVLDCEELVEFANEQQCPSIVFSIVEPTYVLESVLSCLQVLRREGLHGLLVTGGCMTRDALTFMQGAVDGVNLLMPTLSERHARQAHSVPPQALRQNLKRLHDLGIWVEVTTYLLPGFNDSRKEMDRIACTIASVDATIPWHIGWSIPPAMGCGANRSDGIRHALESAGQFGLLNIYSEDAPERDYQLTFCHACEGQLLIDRFGQFVASYLADGDRCPLCDTQACGIFPTQRSVAAR